MLLKAPSRQAVPSHRDSGGFGAIGMILVVLVLVVLNLAIVAGLAGRFDQDPRIQLGYTGVLLLQGAATWALLLFWRQCRNSRRELEASKQVNSVYAARLKAKQALKESHERFRVLANATFEGLIIHDHGLILDVNEAFVNLSGLSREELLGKSILGFLPEAAQAVMKEKFQLPLTSPDQSIGPYEIEFRNQAGDLLHLEVRAKAMPYHGRTVRVAAFKDITERYRLDRAQNELISVVSHELRSPLGSLHSSLELVVRGVSGDLPDRAQYMVGIALESAKRLIRITNQTLEYDYLSSGGYSLNLSNCNAADLMQQAADTMRGFADSHGVTLVIEAPPLCVRADEDRIIQVLVNLLSNAIKFASSGRKVWLRAEATENAVRFDVRDRGPGIPADQVEAVFERFARLDTMTQSRHGGIGLGLPICRNLIALHGGTIGVESPPGGGSTFYFTLPLNNEGAPV